MWKILIRKKLFRRFFVPIKQIVNKTNCKIININIIICYDLLWNNGTREERAT